MDEFALVQIDQFSVLYRSAGVGGRRFVSDGTTKNAWVHNQAEGEDKASCGGAANAVAQKSALLSLGCIRTIIP